MKEKIRKVFFFECVTNERKNKESFFFECATNEGKNKESFFFFLMCYK